MEVLTVHVEGGHVWRLGLPRVLHAQTLVTMLPAVTLSQRYLGPGPSILHGEDVQEAPSSDSCAPAVQQPGELGVPGDGRPAPHGQRAGSCSPATSWLFFPSENGDFVKMKFSLQSISNL